MYLGARPVAVMNQLPNNSIVPPADFTQTVGVSCCTNAPSVIGDWFHPNGLAVNGPNVISLPRSACIELLLETDRQLAAQDEGVYTCNIQDSTGTIRTLFVGIYTSDTYQISGKGTRKNHPLIVSLLVAISSEHYFSRCFLSLGMLRPVVSV